MLLPSPPSRSGLVGIQADQQGRGRRPAPGPWHRPRAPGHHGPRVRRAAPGEPRRQRHRCRQRGGVQLQGAVRGPGVALHAPDGQRLRGDPAAVRRAWPHRQPPRPAPGHVLLHPVRQGARPLLCRQGSHRHHPPLHRLGQRRVGLHRVRDEGAHRRVHQVPELSPRPRLLQQGRARQHLPALVQADVGAGTEARPPPADQRLPGRRPPPRLREGRHPPDDVRRPLGRPPVRRPRLLPRRLHLRPAHRPEVHVLPQAPLLHHRPREQPGHPGRPEGRRLPRDHPPLLHLHPRRGGRRRPGGHPLPRDVRPDHHPRLDAHVPHEPQDQGHGHQDGPVGGGRRRGVRRLPLLPQGPQRPGVLRRDRRQDLPAPHVRLPAVQQGHVGVGRRTPRPVPRCRFPRGGHEPKAGGEDDQEGTWHFQGGHSH
mmetsp:Transcript_16673/g.47859  ORF Transcript_16673/g.47859 Transcript_16673/m.47859 type:complete len:425 (-) Transcript_16673:651-1925(-)